MHDFAPCIPKKGNLLKMQNINNASCDNNISACMHVAISQTKYSDLQHLIKGHLRGLDFQDRLLQENSFYMCDQKKDAANIVRGMMSLSLTAQVLSYSSCRSKLQFSHNWSLDLQDKSTMIWHSSIKSNPSGKEPMKIIFKGEAKCWWVDHLSITFKWTNQVYQGFLLVWKATLAASQLQTTTHRRAYACQRLSGVKGRNTLAQQSCLCLVYHLLACERVWATAVTANNDFINQALLLTLETPV